MEVKLGVHRMPHNISTVGAWFAAVVATVAVLILVGLAMWMVVRPVVAWELGATLGCRRNLLASALI